MYWGVAIWHPYVKTPCSYGLLHFAAGNSKSSRQIVENKMVESADYDREGTAKDNLNENCDEHDAGWDISERMKVIIADLLQMLE
jgi:hypothetical protein